MYKIKEIHELLSLHEKQKINEMHWLNKLKYSTDIPLTFSLTGNYLQFNVTASAASYATQTQIISCSLYI